MAISVTADQIETQISNDIRACETLIALLDQEQEALKNRDPDQLADVIEAKIAPLSQLEQSANQRAKWAVDFGGEASVDVWQEVLQNTNQPKLKDDWRKLKDLTLQCKTKNEVNGKLLIRNQQVYGRLLGLLRGQHTNTNLYTSKGSSMGLNNSNIVGEA